MRTHSLQQAASPYYLFFGALFPTVRSLLIPCDSAGRVEIDALSERVRDNYLFARAVVGCDYRAPVVVAASESQ